MINGRITFIQCYTYDTEGKTEDECFNKAYQLFKNDMCRPIARTGYDDVEEEYKGEEEDEE